MLGIEYDCAGFPLVDSLVNSVEGHFGNKREPFRIGKIVKYDDGSVEFVADNSQRVFDILPSHNVNFHREFVTFDDDVKTFTQLRNPGKQYTTCLKVEE